MIKGRKQLTFAGGQTRGLWSRWISRNVWMLRYSHGMCDIRFPEKSNLFNCNLLISESKEITYKIREYRELRSLQYVDTGKKQDY